jgi:hypothetical protein
MDKPLHVIYKVSKLAYRIWVILIANERVKKKIMRNVPITVAARSESCTVFARSNVALVGSNPIRGTDVCMPLFCVCAVLCEGRGLAKGCSPIQESYWLRNWISGQSPIEGCTVTDEIIKSCGMFVYVPLDPTADRDYEFCIRASCSLTYTTSMEEC